MATERVTRERIIERDTGGDATYVDTGGGVGAGGVIIGIAVLALVAIIAFFLLSSSRNDAVRTEAVTGAASSVAESASTAAGNVGAAADRAAGTVAAD
jgi:hypothetical protein